jgi:hypothetical protein
MVCASSLPKLKIFSLRVPPKNKKYTNSAACEKGSANLCIVALNAHHLQPCRPSQQPEALRAAI